MTINPINILRRHQDEPKLGAVAREALAFLEGAQCRFLQSPGPGQSASSVIRMYEIRRSLKKFKESAFLGLQESIDSLREHDVTVHLSAIETEKGIVSLWLQNESSPPVAIVIAKFEATG
jgi:hypothetical protein